MLDNKSILIFGAGKIGRSFIGQLFGCSGYSVIFVDVDQKIIDALNQKGCYRVVIKGEKEEEIIVPIVKAIPASEKETVIQTICEAGILAIAVGKNFLESTIPLIAGGLMARNSQFPGMPLDIILAENMRSAADFVKNLLISYLPVDFPVENMVGLIETSIGKMVPVIPAAELEIDPLVVFAEPYNTLILDRKGFKNPVPDVAGLAPKDNIKAWVDRKAFIHNLGHATAAYYGHYLHPGSVYLYEVPEDQRVVQFTREVMLQSARILLAAYPEVFTLPELESHIDDLINRFRNKPLMDTIHRVGQDLTRKLGSDDRFMGSIHLAMQHQKPYDLILKALSYGLRFDACDESGNSLSADKEFLSSLTTDFKTTLTNISGYHKVHDLPIIEGLLKLYKEIN